jgi:hypothetical protein
MLVRVLDEENKELKTSNVFRTLFEHRREITRGKM